jgi:hypothetical protein
MRYSLPLPLLVNLTWSVSDAATAALFAHNSIQVYAGELQIDRLQVL